MKGKVLGYDAASGTGAINGDDGKRYTFATTDYKNPVPAKPNDSVDFEADGGAAKNIYVVKTGFSMPPIGTPGGAAPVTGGAVAGGDFVEMIKAKPYVIWAAIVILGSLFAGYVTSTFSFMQLGGTSFLFILLFLLPILAGVLIFFELTNHPMTAQARMVTGIAAVALPILIPLVAGAGAGAIGGVFGGFGLGPFADFFGFNITIGKILTVGGGVLILLTYFKIMPQKLG